MDAQTVTKDTICGIDRYEHSAAYGELVVEGVVLWHMPNPARVPSSVKGAVKHGDEVEVITTARYKGVLWAKVKCTAYEKEQRGWLSATLLSEMGKAQPGIKELD